jgi:hypothetical protein
MNKKGKYFRFYNANPENAIIGFCITGKDFLTFRKLKKEVDKNICTIQCINYRKNENYDYQFDDLGKKYNPTTKNKITSKNFIHQLYNYKNEIVENKSILFELTDDFLKVGNKKLKLVVKGYLYDYSYKILKTQINIRDKEEFQKFIIDSMKNDSPFNSWVNGLLHDIEG